MKLLIKEKNNRCLKVILTDDTGRNIRFDGPEEDFDGPAAALAVRGLISFLREKSPECLPEMEKAFPEGLLHFRGERSFAPSGFKFAT